MRPWIRSYQLFLDFCPRRAFLAAPGSSWQLLAAPGSPWQPLAATWAGQGYSKTNLIFNIFRVMVLVLVLTLVLDLLGFGSNWFWIQVLGFGSWFWIRVPPQMTGGPVPPGNL